MQFIRYSLQGKIQIQHNYLSLDHIWIDIITRIGNTCNVRCYKG